MIAQVTAASLVSENKVLCHPASVDSIPSSAGREDHVSMGATSATKAARVITNARVGVAIEMMVAAQGLDMRLPLRAGAGVARGARRDPRSACDAHGRPRARTRHARDRGDDRRDADRCDAQSRQRSARWPEPVLVATTAALCAAAFTAGTIDAIAGGGGLITVPALLAAGLPAHAVLGTNKGQSTFGSFSALASFCRAGALDRDARARCSRGASSARCAAPRSCSSCRPRRCAPWCSCSSSASPPPSRFAPTSAPARARP